MNGRTILLIVGGGIAAYKTLDLLRELRRAGARVLPVLTEGGARFVTPLSLSALAEERVRTSLWDLEDEATMGHIALSRAANLILVCPATADLMARAAAGMADDLATTLLLATDTPVMMAPAMNVRMWQHAATSANVATLRARGMHVIEPATGAMACGETGPGRLPDVPDLMRAVAAHFAHGPLAGRHVLVTAGPTHEPIDPVRFIANRSSGKQGFAIAAALAAAGARVSLVAGPVALPTPRGVDRIDVETAAEMAAAVARTLPADAAVMVAAVADWRVDAATAKIKKGAAPPALSLVENADILAGLAVHPQRPQLLIGFAAETGDLLEKAKAKRARKGVDWLVANDVAQGVFGTESNHVHLLTAAGTEDWGPASKAAIADRLVARIVETLAE
ncbi:phosphopantothenate synthase [Polymorphobacter multimanifer]|uniref:Coenzyme A biosynthesis bifunctional protein CoaBC n=1 Tax=Polymorphobacter multimanifer TaxID=1070431 RepID=A0A841LBZ0_9SPHN|nr:bifunctional phosphopantothenoylcysteine decarboxylase/phosphopantothenate--cysteine ligase CoaBC [Polymorphobacter multimanifer]MBB6226508.1 phosphopantothenoylcysteine decarboxylase/phosphopantothenate--cysteine ligase [Polymorphobacter multimanifer]GGI75758.1 phosphopantothenate synthase [Polymorphobacter multimanifer]